MPEQGHSTMRDAGVSRADRRWIRWQSFCDAAKVPTDTLLSYEELAAAYEHETGTSCPVQYVVSLVHAVSDDERRPRCPRCRDTGIEPHPKTPSRRGTGIWGQDQNEPCSMCNGQPNEPGE